MVLPSFLPDDLREALTPAVVGVMVGAVVGIVGFVIVLFVATRPRRVLVQPYPTMGRATPLPPVWTGEPAFVPSTELSARALAKMGFPVAPYAGRVPPPPPSIVEVEPIAPASMADFEVDDSPTEIGETWFDVVAPPRSRGTPPKIRAVAPLPPRFPPRGAPAKTQRSP